MSNKSTTPKIVPKKDEYTRITYLYQTSCALHERYPQLARGYSRSGTIILKKSVLKLSPEMKRSVCKKCNTVMIPGISMRIRTENKSKSKAPEHEMLIYECSTCGKPKRFPVGKGEYLLWHQRMMAEPKVEETNSK